MTEPFYFINKQKYELAINNEYGARAYGIFFANQYLFVVGKNEDTALPFYWKNDKIMYLPIDELGDGNSIYISNNDVYISWYNEYYTDKYNLIYTPCYWKNGERIDLSKPLYNYDGLAFSIFVLDNDVYVAGYISDRDYDIPCYWKNGVRIELQNPSKNSCAFGIIVNNDDVYVAGFFEEDNAVIPCYWKNGQKTNLSNINGGRALSISMCNGNIYISGYTKNENDIEIPCYWKNDERIDVDIKGRCESIFVLEN
jgi:hypothetical protein